MLATKEFRKSGKAGFRHHSTALAAFVGGLALVAGTAHANLISDGDFEQGTVATLTDTYFNGPYTSFVSWKLGANSYFSGFVTQATSPIDGAYSAKYTTPGATGQGMTMYQTFASSSSAFDVTLSAAALAPASGGRAVNIILSTNGADPTLTGNAMINFKVIPAANSSTTTGDVQLDTGSFVTVLPNGFNWSTAGNFDTAGEPVNTIEIVGTISSGSASYKTIVNGVSSVVETSAQTTPTGFLSALAITNSTAGSANLNGAFVVDDVAVDGATPEPASICLMAIGAAGLLMRRRRTA